MACLKVLLAILLISFCFISAQAITIVEPIQNYHYDTQNIKFNATNNNTENSTTCDFNINLEDTDTQTISPNGTYQTYLSGILPDNTLTYNCSLSEGYENGTISFYYDIPTTTDTSTSDMMTVFFSFILVIFLLIVIFKFKS